MSKPDAGAKSIGSMIDELSVTNIKIFMEIEKVMAGTGDARKTQELNALRSGLIRAIDRRLGESGLSPSEKTYG